MKLKKLIFSLLCFLSVNSYSNNLVLQHGGELGNTVLGYGFNFGKTYSLEFIYGYHPEVNTLAIRNNLSVLNYKSFNLNLGLTVYQVDKPKRGSIPNGYYEQSLNRRLYLYYAIDYTYNNQYSLYFENGINDVMAEAYYNNDNLSLNDLASIGFGMRIFFE